jgi:hypothetical protein
MTTTEDRPPSLGERYLCSSGTSRIEVDADRRTDADYLIAAGAAQVGNLRASMALTLYRLSEDWRANVESIERRAGISKEVERMLLVKREALRPGVSIERREAILASLDASLIGERYRMRTDFDALPPEAQAVFALADKALDWPRRTKLLPSTAEIVDAVAQLLPPPPQPRTLPSELIALHDWSVPTLRRQFTRLRYSHASLIAERVLRWTLTDVCQACGGRGYTLLPGTNIRSDNLCSECGGVGRSPVESRLKKSHREAGRWLASEFAQMLTYVLSEMAQRLRPSLDICLDRAPELAARLVELRSAEAQQD